MADRFHAAGAAPELSAEVCAILLAGWSAHVPGDVDPGPHGFGHGLLECFDADGPARLWREHEQFLRQTAQRWGWPPRHGVAGRPMFYAEHLAAADGA